jgi:hypothetical protein
LPGIEEEEAPTSTTRSHVNLAPSNSNQVFWRRCREGRRLLQGDSRTHNFFTLFLFCFILFLLALFYQKYKKKLASFIVVTSLLLVRYVVL